MDRKANLKRKKARRSNKLSIMMITFIVFVLCGVIAIQMKDLGKQQKDLASQETQLQTQLAKQQQRTKDLEERKVYVQTKKYIEEAAGKLGYVYPDQIILKPEK